MFYKLRITKDMSRSCRVYEIEQVPHNRAEQTKGSNYVEYNGITKQSVINYLSNSL
jgi:hypothetical protein